MTETIKLVFTFLIALVVIVGGGAMLVMAPNLDPLIKGAIIASIGSVIAFVFGGEIQTRTARQQERALLTNPSNGNATYTIGGGTVTPTIEEPTS